MIRGLGSLVRALYRDESGERFNLSTEETYIYAPKNRALRWTRCICLGNGTEWVRTHLQSWAWARLITILRRFTLPTMCSKRNRWNGDETEPSARWDIEISASRFYSIRLEVVKPIIITRDNTPRRRKKRFTLDHSFPVYQNNFLEVPAVWEIGVTVFEWRKWRMVWAANCPRINLSNGLELITTILLHSQRAPSSIKRSPWFQAS